MFILLIPSRVPSAIPVNAEWPNASEKNAILLFTIIVPNIANIGDTNKIAINAFFINVYCIKSNGSKVSSMLYIMSIIFSFLDY